MQQGMVIGALCMVESCSNRRWGRRRNRIVGPSKIPSNGRLAFLRNFLLRIPSDEANQAREKAELRKRTRK